MPKLNCWEVKVCCRNECGRESGTLCPASKETKLNGVHGGINAGRACWIVAGTLCGGSEQGTYAKKYHNCEKCDFFVRVQQEEGQNYEPPLSIITKLKRAEIESY